MVFPEHFSVLLTVNTLFYYYLKFTQNSVTLLQVPYSKVADFSACSLALTGSRVAFVVFWGRGFFGSFFFLNASSALSYNR